MSRENLQFALTHAQPDGYREDMPVIRGTGDLQCHSRRRNAFRIIRYFSSVLCFYLPFIIGIFKNFDN